METVNVCPNFRINDLQVRFILQQLDFAHPNAETFILNKYGIKTIEEIYYGDYEAVKEDIGKHMGWKRKKFAPGTLG